MNPRQLITPGLALFFVFALCFGVLLDGPSELDAMRATAAAKQDAIKSAASQAINTKARGQKEHKTMVARVQP